MDEHIGGGKNKGRRTWLGGGKGMPKWAKTPLIVNRIPSALICCRVHEPGDGSALKWASDVEVLVS